MSDQEVRFRKATSEDEAGVFAISDNVYYGLDYLRYHYDEYLNDPNRECFVAEDDGGVIVGFLLGYVVDDGRRCLLQAARVKEGLQGLNIYRNLLSYVKDEMKKTHPSVGESTFVTWNLNPATKRDSFWAVHSKIATRVCINKAISPTEFSSHTSQFAALVQPGIEQVTESTLRSLIGSAGSGGDALLAGNRLVRFWEPFELLPQNAAILLKYTLGAFSHADAQRHVATMCFICHGHFDVGPRLDLDLSGRDHDLLLSQLGHALQFAFQTDKMARNDVKHQVLINVDAEVKQCTLDAILALVAPFQDGAVPLFDQYVITAAM